MRQEAQDKLSYGRGGYGRQPLLKSGPSINHCTEQQYCVVEAWAGRSVDEAIAGLRTQINRRILYRSSSIPCKISCPSSTACSSRRPVHIRIVNQMKLAKSVDSKAITFGDLQGLNAASGPCAQAYT